MTTTVRQLFNHVGISAFQKIHWGTPFNETGQGVYVVSTSCDPETHLGLTVQPNFDNQIIELWLNKLSNSNFQVDGVPANLQNLKNRLAEFWLPDESILYIGQASTRKNNTGISKRVREYVSTEIGNRGPHSGGQWIKVLKDLNTFTVYYGVCGNPREIEKKMLNFFMSNVSKKSLLNQYDKTFPLPFANIRFAGNKSHGFKNQRL